MKSKFTGILTILMLSLAFVSSVNASAFDSVEEPKGVSATIICSIVAACLAGVGVFMALGRTVYRRIV